MCIRDSPWLDAGIVPYSTLDYTNNREYWNDWFPAEFVVESFPGQFRNWFYSLLAMSAMMEGKAPFKNLLGHALVKAEDGRDMHKSWGNAIWFDDAAEKMGVDVMRWMYVRQNVENNLLFGYKKADDVRKRLIGFWNIYSFFCTYANVDSFEPNKNNHGLPYNPIKACVVPRPIGWITTVSNDGLVNAAPFSFFNALSYNPPFCLFSAGGHTNDEEDKDTVANVKANGEFVYNMATWSQREEMNETGFIIERNINELTEANLKPVPSKIVKPPRISGSPAVSYTHLTLPTKA